MTNNPSSPLGDREQEIQTAIETIKGIDLAVLTQDEWDAIAVLEQAGMALTPNLGISSSQLGDSSPREALPEDLATESVKKAKSALIYQIGKLRSEADQYIAGQAYDVLVMAISHRDRENSVLVSELQGELDYIQRLEVQVKALTTDKERLELENEVLKGAVEVLKMESECKLCGDTMTERDEGGMWCMKCEDPHSSAEGQHG